MIHLFTVLLFLCLPSFAATEYAFQHVHQKMVFTFTYNGNEYRGWVKPSIFEQIIAVRAAFLCLVFITLSGCAHESRKIMHECRHVEAGPPDVWVCETP